jgi:hypothetical protein
MSEHSLNLWKSVAVSVDSLVSHFLENKWIMFESKSQKVFQLIVVPFLVILPSFFFHLPYISQSPVILISLNVFSNVSDHHELNQATPMTLGDGHFDRQIVDLCCVDLIKNRLVRQL